MRYQVPQFIEVESKIFGPLTLKQFIYLVGGAGILFLLYIALPIWLVFLLGIPIVAFSLSLSFYKINNRPFIKVTEDVLRYFSSPRLFLWKKTQPKPVFKKELDAAQRALPGGEVFIPKITKSKLKDLAWSLDIQQKIK